jgi:2-dehydropantoate 2-reductase
VDNSGKNDAWPQITVVGAGAVGGYFGGMLAAAGAPVVMVGRRPFVDAVNAEGLLLETQAEKKRITVAASADIAAASEADVILFSVKTNDTATAAQALGSVMKPGAIVLSLQNGVDNVERIREAAGINTLAAAVYVSASVVQPGHVRHLARGDLLVGPEAKSFSELFMRAHVPCQVSKNLIAELWAKLACNCALNAVSALARVSYGRIIEHPKGHSIIDAIVDEIFAVARATGIKSANFETPEALRAVVLNLAREMPTTLSSTAQDLLRGKPTEIDSLNGYISRRGAPLGVPTPVNETLSALIKIFEATKRDME